MSRRDDDRRGSDHAGGAADVTDLIDLRYVPTGSIWRRLWGMGRTAIENLRARLHERREADHEQRLESWRRD